MNQGKSPVRRCAIYTRKSSEEGLEQDFNSLHAQREACEAFIKSQQGEGWRLIKTAYDDGGFSGGTMERPALKQLLDDIGKRLVDVVVVYKVDRLTRSLADFAKMVEVFDAHGVSFVAVTQQFNTTTSMGRLTLNVLLSFAQFEREVTGERIRDKIAASKRKGFWMGGVPPLGYDIRDRRLVISQVEAEIVREIYQRYLELGSVRLLQSDLDRRGIVSKVRVSKKGVKSGGHSFLRGALYELLSNPIYIGEIRHRKERHPGQHEPILERELWEKAQEHLRNHAAQHRERPTKALPSPLAGKLFDENGEPLYAQGASKGGRRYRYYVSRALVRGSAKDAHGGWRVAAPEIERAVTIASRQLLENQAALNEAVGASADLKPALDAASEWNRRLRSEAEAPAALVELIERVELAEGGVRISLKLPMPSDRVTATAVGLSSFVPIKMKKRGVELRIVLGANDDAPRSVDPALLRAIARASRWFEELASGQVRSLAEIAKREKLGRRYVERVTRLAFVAPGIVNAIAEGRPAVGINLQMLMDGRLALPLQWTEQDRLLNLD